jgi:ADP-ribose pyrophosphatase YjhB (NUDIX family)
VAAPVPCAGGIVHDGDGRLLVILRGHAPSAGTWSVPGGRCLPDEPAPVACVREVFEETGLAVAVRRWAGRIERAAPGGRTYVIDDYICSAVGGTLHAGDDAVDARWVNRVELRDLPLAPGLWDTLREWELLPD